MSNIIRDRALVATASTADLIATYNALTGNNVERFSTRAIAERRTDMAIMAAEDAAGHRGVWKDTKPVAMTAAELSQDAPNSPTEEVERGVASESEENPFKPGSMAHQLWVATKSWEANSKPREKRAPKDKSEPKQKRRVALVVKATFAGASAVQSGSKRAAVLKAIQEAPDGTMTLAALDAQFEEPTRGYVHKLIEKNHLIALDAE